MRSLARAQLAVFGHRLVRPLALAGRDRRAQRLPIGVGAQRFLVTRHLVEGLDESLIIELLTDFAVRERAAVDVGIVPPIIHVIARLIATPAAVGARQRLGAVGAAPPRRALARAAAADAAIVAVGRATLYGVAAAGEAGATRALEILEAEIRRTMAVMGLNRISEISRDHIRLPADLPVSGQNRL